MKPVVVATTVANLRPLAPGHVVVGTHTTHAGRAFFLVVVLAMLLSFAPAQAQQQTLYGADGRVIGRSVTDSQGTTTHYDAAGRRIGTTTTRDGTITVYGPDGRRTGTATGTPTKPPGRP